MSERPALSTLLSQALVAFTVELDNEFEHRSAYRRGTAGRTARWPHFPVVSHRGGFPDGS